MSDIVSLPGKIIYKQKKADFSGTWNRDFAKIDAFNL
jgi:hypothetical protein